MEITWEPPITGTDPDLLPDDPINTGRFLGLMRWAGDGNHWLKTKDGWIQFSYDPEEKAGKSF